MIPKVIYISCEDKNNLHPSLLKNIQEIIFKNPTYKVVLCDNKDYDKYFIGHKNECYYNKINKSYGVLLADYWRYNIINDNGGIYLDVKSNFRKSIEDIIDDSEFILHYNSVKYLGKLDEEYINFNLMSIKNNPLLEIFIDKVNMNIMDYTKEKVGVGKLAVLNTTSGRILFKLIQDLLKVDNTKEQIQYHNSLKIKIYPSYRKNLIFSNVGDYKKLYNKPHYKYNKEPLII